MSLSLFKHILVGERDTGFLVTAGEEFFMTVTQEHFEERPENGALLSEIGEWVARLVFLSTTRLAIRKWSNCTATAPELKV